jgi:predicted O-methyltransferase YrrM
MEYSMLYSLDDALSGASERLLDVALGAAVRARRIDLHDVAQRLGGRFPYPDAAINLWPGEHYRLLAGLVQELQPQLVVEIGTAEGISALSMLKELPAGGRILSFDIVPWQEYPRTCLRPGDFEDGRLVQVIDDLGSRPTFERHAPQLAHADLIFIDAAKDGSLEQRLIAHFGQLAFARAPIVVFDDIRLWNMLAIWRNLPWPKLDLTSFGHWCGTGLAEPPRHA